MADGIVNVLVVDDNPAQRLALTAILAELGVNLVEAASGREALRCLLQQEFAVILLDVNMPGIDGFETAALIRERPSSAHTPIIFVTAYSDDAHAARGYSLGAVDFILSPVRPDVLRTKVAVFIELYRKTEQVTRQREALSRYAGQLRQLSEASLAVHSARSIEELLATVASRAAAIIGARQATVTAAPRAGAPALISAARMRADGAIAPAEAVGRIAHYDVTAPARYERGAALPWDGASELIEGVPMSGWLATPLTGHDGRAFGALQLSDRVDGEFSEDDQGILVQLAQMASIAIENTLAAEAHEANRLKDEFLSVLSHELRTPLQAMLTWINILRGDGAGNGAMLSRGLEVIERSARSQVRLIGDLLDVSRIIRGQLHLETGAVELVTVVDLALETLRPAAAAKQIALHWNRPKGESGIEGDAARLQQVVSNLVSNAIKFTPAGGEVHVELSVRPAEVNLVVRDSGPGIPADFLPHMFERFRQAESGSARGQGGLGLGLAIVRHLIELHGGSVRAENAAQGGAVLTVTLPPRPALRPSAVGWQGRSSVPAVMPGNGVHLDGIHVVLVEDEDDTRESLCAALQSFGAHVVAVSSAVAALSALETERPDVLLSDIGMPEQDGYSLIRQVRAREQTPEARLPAAALTAYVRAEDHASALRAGFDAHIHKPVEPLELARAVQRLARRA
jgi:signal transduction histidine kinase/DNA-binding response OmpR family regulator